MRTNDAPLPQHDEPENALVSRLPSRRRVLVLSGAAGAVVLGGAGTAAGRNVANGSTLDSVKAAVSASSACMPLTTEQIEAPYYIDDELFRGNVVEDRTGIPLLLVLRAVDSATGKPIRDSAVEIWHCDASGVYSGYTRNGNGGGSGTPPARCPPARRPPTAAPGGPGGPGGAGGSHATPTDDLTWLRGIESTETTHPISPSASATVGTAAKIRAHVPSTAQRSRRL